MKIAKVLPIVAVISLLVTGPAWAEVAGPEIKVGALLPLSGPMTSQGVQQKAALEIAIEEINGAGGVGGVSIKLIIYDSGGKGEEAISTMKKAIEVDKALAVLGPFLSAQCKVAFPVANRAGVPAITASCAAPGVTAENRPWTFRVTTPTDVVYEPEIAKWKELYPRLEKVVILTDSKDFFSYTNGTKIYPPILQKHNIKLLDTITFQTGDVDYSAQVTKAKSLNPDGVIIASLLNEGALVVREMRKQGMAQPVVGGYGLAEGLLFQLVPKEMVEGTIFGTDFWEERPYPKTRTFVAKMKQKLAGITVRNTAVSMYDAIYILKYALEKGGITNKPEEIKADREKVRAVLEALKDFDGATSPTSFNKDGDAIRPTYVLQAKGGRFEKIY